MKISKIKMLKKNENSQRNKNFQKKEKLKKINDISKKINK